MVNLGMDNKNDNYKAKFLNELEPGEEIEGEIHIGEIKKRHIKNQDVYEFFIIITDSKKKEKWICGIVTSFYAENGNIYGEKEGRVYSLIDSLNHVINGTLRNIEESYSVKFETFRKNINKNVENIKIKAVQSWKPGAKEVNLEVLEVKLLKDSQSESERIKSLAEVNNPVKITYDELKIKDKDINKKSIAFHLKHLLDSDEITKSEFKEALKELDKL